VSANARIQHMWKSCWDTGHFALEEEGDFIAERIKAFLWMNGGKDKRS
jgi:hypothetical protein